MHPVVYQVLHIACFVVIIAAGGLLLRRKAALDASRAAPKLGGYTVALWSVGAYVTGGTIFLTAPWLRWLMAEAWLQRLSLADAESIAGESMPMTVRSSIAMAGVLCLVGTAAVWFTHRR
jgi:hypothetical protein